MEVELAAPRNLTEAIATAKWLAAWLGRLEAAADAALERRKTCAVDVEPSAEQALAVAALAEFEVAQRLEDVLLLALDLLERTSAERGARFRCALPLRSVSALPDHARTAAVAAIRAELEGVVGPVRQDEWSQVASYLLRGESP
ncbi:hypothetical protein [Sorangium sp. So ce131]|uniref:hypothetical protein n=1 Tax=Sorangium sp. So ce131 TaxID=3133282 RepID=UPI003F6194D8